MCGIHYLRDKTDETKASGLGRRPALRMMKDGARDHGAGPVRPQPRPGDRGPDRDRRPARQGGQRGILPRMRAGQVPLNVQEAIGRPGLNLRNWRGMIHGCEGLALRRSEQEQRQHREKPQQDPARPHRGRTQVPAGWRGCHPCAAQT